MSACGAPFSSVFSSSAVGSAKELGLGRCSPAAASAAGFGLVAWASLRVPGRKSSATWVWEGVGGGGRREWVAGRRGWEAAGRRVGPGFAARRSRGDRPRRERRRAQRVRVDDARHLLRLGRGLPGGRAGGGGCGGGRFRLRRRGIELEVRPKAARGLLLDVGLLLRRRVGPLAHSEEEAEIRGRD